MRFLVTGAAGFVGASLCAYLQSRGYFVRAAMRSAGVREVGNERFAVGEINAETEWGQALQNIDVVIHLASRAHVMREKARDPLAEFRKTNVAGTINLATQAAEAGVKRLIYVSSVGVNGSRTAVDSPFVEADEPNPHSAYALSKFEAEQALRGVTRDTKMEVVIIRPPLVYGPSAPGNFAELVKVLRKGIPLPFGSVRNLRSFIYVGNLNDVLLLCAIHPAAAGEIYLVSDGDDISTPDLLRRLGAKMGKDVRLFPFPLVFLRFASRLVGRRAQIDRLVSSLRVDSDKVRKELGWVAPCTLDQGLDETAAWYRNNTTNSGGQI